MARSHGRLMSTVWSDPDWRSLSVTGQWCYSMLLSQSKLNLVGVLDLMPGRWAKFADGCTVEDIELALSELETARFIVIDRDTDEVLIRTMVRHDIATSRLNVNLIKGLWSAWAGVTSNELRQVVVDNIPDEIWEDARCNPDAAALRMRRSLPLEPMAETIGCDQTNEPNERTSVISLPSPSPVICRQDSHVPTKRPDLRSERKSRTDPLPPDPYGPSLLPVGFEAFWNEWPEEARIGEPEARRKWKATRNKASEIELLQAVVAWKSYWRAIGTEAIYIPRAANWLMRGDWMTSPPEVPRSKADRWVDDTVDVVQAFLEGNQ